MTPDRRPRTASKTPWVLLRGLAVAWAGIGLAVAPAAGQLEALVSEREAEYRSWLNRYQGALDAREAIRSRWEQALLGAGAARRSGDDDLYDAAQARMLGVSQEMGRIENRLDEVRDSLQAATGRFLDALDARRERIEQRLAADPDPGARADLLALVRDLQNQYRQVEETTEEAALRAVLVFQPEIRLDPRDLPDELRFKARVAETRVEQADSALADIDRQMERLEARLRLERVREDSRASRGRFDEDRLPVGAATREREGERATPADSITAELQELSLPEQIELLNRERARVIEYREQMRRNAVRIRERLRRIT